MQLTTAYCVYQGAEPRAVNALQDQQAEDLWLLDADEVVVIHGTMMRVTRAGEGAALTAMAAGAMMKEKTGVDLAAIMTRMSGGEASVTGQKETMVGCQLMSQHFHGPDETCCSSRVM